MSIRIPNSLRDQMVTAFRERIIDKRGIVPFVHQRSWWCATDGLILHDEEEAEPGDPSGRAVALPDGTVKVWKTSPRPGGRARVVADLGAFKTGKSFGSGVWGAAFACIPDARVKLVGLEYDICAPEFDYICENLLSAQGLNLKYDSLQNRPRDGKMWLDLPNGARYEARSWERKEALKGKEDDAYIYCEAYQLPGIECYTSFKQNLSARDGYAIFATTPDRPWVQEIHDRAHSGDPEWRKWACICGVDRSVNRFTYDAADRARDKQLMTREKFAIHYEGKLGDFVGRVFNFQRGQLTFTAGSHPILFPTKQTNRESLVCPDGWQVMTGVDTGTFYTALTVLFSPSGDAFVVDEYPNYRYVAGSPDRDEDITIPEWTAKVREGIYSLGGPMVGWADANSQFKKELLAYGIHLLSATLPVEARTEICREYLQQGKLWLAPWLEVLPFELENAKWPDEASATGKFARVKDRDHTLDCLEHVLSRRPRGTPIESKRLGSTWAEEFANSHGGKRRFTNEHLGAN